MPLDAAPDVRDDLAHLKPAQASIDYATDRDE